MLWANTILKGLSSEMEGSRKVTSTESSPFKQWTPQYDFFFIKGAVSNLHLKFCIWLAKQRVTFQVRDFFSLCSWKYYYGTEILCYSPIKLKVNLLTLSLRVTAC